MAANIVFAADAALFRQSLRAGFCDVPAKPVASAHRPLAANSRGTVHSGGDQVAEQDEELREAVSALAGTLNGGQAHVGEPERGSNCESRLLRIAE